MRDGRPTAGDSWRRCGRSIHMLRSLPILLTLLLVLPACRAEDDIKRGEDGEWCNGRDDDCREGLFCIESRCRAAGRQPTYDCDDICARLGECEATESGCPSDCRITTSGWRFDARESFGLCLVDELSCSEATASFAPQTCYARIPVPEGRAARCAAFGSAARRCTDDLDKVELVLEACTALARVSRDAAWMETDTCTEPADTGNCAQLATCLDAAFELESPLSL